MDSETARAEKQIEAIKKSVREGRLEPARLKRLLNEEIRLELQKPVGELNAAYVRLCRDLLEELAGERAAAFPSRFEENCAAMEPLVHQARKRREARPRPALRFAVVAACALALFLAADVLWQRKRLTASVTPDEEQYVLEEELFLSPSLSRAQAGGDGEEETPPGLSGVSWEEASAFLGYTPAEPGWLPEGWALESCEAYLEEELAEFLAHYRRPGTERALHYSVVRYRGDEIVRRTFEQDPGSGETVSVSGREIYLATNGERRTAVWTDGEQTCSLQGPVEREELLRIVESIENKGE